MPDPVVGSDARPRDGGRPVPERKCSRLRSQRGRYDGAQRLKSHYALLPLAAHPYREDRTAW